MKIIILIFISLNLLISKEISFLTINKQTNELVRVSSDNDFESLGELNFLDGSSISLETIPNTSSIYLLKGNGELYLINTNNLEHSLLCTLNSPNEDINGSWRGISINNRGDIYVFNEVGGSEEGKLYKLLDLQSGLVEQASNKSSGSPSILGIEFDNSNRLWAIEQCCKHNLRVFSGFTGESISYHKNSVSINYPEDLAYFEGQEILIGIDIKNEFTADKTDYFFADRETGITTIFATLEGNFTGVAEISETSSVERIFDNEIYTANIYPNPTSDIFTISSENTISNIRVYNSTGFLLLEFNNPTTKLDVDLSNYASGVYIIEYEINNNSYIKKVAKE